MRDYFILQPELSDHFGGVDDDDPRLTPNMWKVNEGRRLGAAAPADLTFRLGTSYAGLAIADLIQNELGYYLASPRLAQVLATEPTAEVELMPFQLLDRKGKKRPTVLVVRDDLRDALVAAGVEGVELVAMGEPVDL